MIKALIFDFDGLILDTESPVYQSWQEIYQSYGCSLSLSKWLTCIGTADAFDPCANLEDQLQVSVNRDVIHEIRRERVSELMEAQSILPGVRDRISEAEKLGLKLAVASSSPRSWVVDHLSRFELETHFSTIKCAEDVENVKPDPALFLESLEDLNVGRQEAVVLEDSLNGVVAAKRAGIFCVAVPNALTQYLSLDLADLKVSSLAELSIKRLANELKSNML